MLSRVTVSDLKPGETVFPKETVSVRKWRGQFLKEEKLYLVVERGGMLQHVLYANSNSVLFFKDEAEVTYFCRKHNLELVEEKKGGEMIRVTEADLHRGETVYLSLHDSGSVCLLVKRNGLIHVVLRDDGSVKLFDGRGEIELYCRAKGFVPSMEYARTVVREKLLLPSGTPGELSSPEHEEFLPPLAPEVEKLIQEAFVEVIRRQASRDLERLVSLTEERERLLEELSLELIRREAWGNKSCLCRTCRHKLESPVREVQAEIDKIWAWWTTSLGVTPADVVADRWSS